MRFYLGTGCGTHLSLCLGQKDERVHAGTLRLEGGERKKAEKGSYPGGLKKNVTKTIQPEGFGGGTKIAYC